MRKIKKLLSFITATFVAVSLALSGGVASALTEQQIENELNKLVVRYSDGTSKLLNQHGGWLKLFASVLGYAEAKEADVKLHGTLDSNNYWADYIAAPNGFKADPSKTLEAESNNLKQMLNNFNHSDRYWQSGYRIKDDYKLFVDWGAIYFTVENANQQAKRYATLVYDSTSFLNKIREIYNLDPSTHENQKDLLCLRAILRAMVEYDKILGISYESELDSFFDKILDTFFTEELIYIVSSDKDFYSKLKISDDFALGDRNSRQNAVYDYEVIAKDLLSAYYGLRNDDSSIKKEGKDYKIVYDENGYVAKIEPIKGSQEPDANKENDHNNEDNKNTENKDANEISYSEFIRMVLKVYKIFMDDSDFPVSNVKDMSSYITWLTKKLSSAYDMLQKLPYFSQQMQKSKSFTYVMQTLQYISHLIEKSPSWAEIKEKLPYLSGLMEKLPSWAEIKEKLPSWAEIKGKLPSWAEIKGKLPSWAEIKEKLPSWTEIEKQLSAPFDSLMGMLPSWSEMKKQLSAPLVQMMRTLFDPSQLNGDGSAFPAYVKPQKDSEKSALPASVKPQKDSEKSAAGGGGPEPKEYVIKRTGSGVEQFVPTVVALTAGLSGAVGLAYVVSRRKREC